MQYSRIAQALQEISLAPRGCKADLAASLLSEIEPGSEMLCPAVRLLLGELWPPWEKREMGIGPESLITVLSEVSYQDIPLLLERLNDVGMVAEAALEQKGQNSLFCEPLKVQSVYERLLRISEMNGKESEQRKNALLRGLFLDATPREGKYIARTALRNMHAGIGHKTMIAALSRSMHCDQEKIQRAYGLMPDLGSIAVMAQSRKLEEVTFRAKVPVSFMLFRESDPVVPGCFLPKYPGLRVQVHKIKKEVLVFTNQLRNITASLSGISRQLEGMEPDFIVDADLIGFHDCGIERNVICSQAEMLRYINRRHLSRKSRICPSLLAYDLIALQGEDICSMPYQDRRKRLLSILGEPKAMPFLGISPARQYLLMDRGEVEKLLNRAGIAGARALLGRDLSAPYCPGLVAERDFIIRAEHNLAAMIVQVSWSRDRDEKITAKYQVALRSGEDLVPVGWAWRGLSENDQLLLSNGLRSLIKDEHESDDDAHVQVVLAQVVLNLKIRGAQKSAGKYIIFQPVIEGFMFGASPSDADDLMKLEKICTNDPQPI